MTTAICRASAICRKPSWSAGQTGAKWQNVSERGAQQARTARRVKPTPTATAPASWSCWHRFARICTPSGGIDDARAAIEMIVAVYESHRVGGPAAIPLANRDNPLAKLTK